MAIESINPATGQRIRRYEPMSLGDVGERLERSHHVQREWARASFAERGAVLRRTAAVLRADAEPHARLMAAEMGKPLPQGRSEVEKCAWACEYFADNAERFLAPEPIETDARRSYVAFRPLGTVLAVMPWNFPFWQVFRAAAPCLMAGNAVVLKHSSNVHGCALAIAEALERAELPEGLFTAVPLPSDHVADLIAHPLISAVTLTGSTPAGKSVAKAAGGALKKTVLELGGSDPYVVLEDADLDHAAKTCVEARLQNTGQSCIAAKRFVVVESVRAAFTERVVGLTRSKRHGDPLADEGVDLGPLARADLRDDLHSQVRRSIEAGARLLLGGEVPPSRGSFYPATVLADVRPGMPAYSEETFGPVAAILAARDEDDAIRIANDTSYGLGAAVFTRDVARGERLAAEKLDAGCCFVNALVRSDPRLPFGGVKESGYGRELAAFGIREFVNVKSVYVGK